MSTLKHLTAISLVLLIFGGCLLPLHRIIWPDRTLATFDLGNGYAIHVWSHLDWSAVVPTSYIRYRVTHGSDEVIPETFLELNHGQQYKAVFAENGQLACAFPEQGGRRIIVVDLRTRESWPRHMDADEAGRPIPNERWIERYKKLADENAGIARLRELARQQ